MGFTQCRQIDVLREVMIEVPTYRDDPVDLMLIGMPESLILFDVSCVGCHFCQRGITSGHVELHYCRY